MTPILTQVAASVATTPIVNAVMPIDDRGTSGRTVESTSRSLDLTARQPIRREYSGIIATVPDNSQNGQNWLATLIPPATGESIGISAPSRSSSTLSNAQYPTRNISALVSGGTTQVNGNIADDDLSLADIFLRTFGQSQGISPVQQPNTSVVPIGESGGGSNILLILAILGAAGFGIWYFYFR